MHSGPWAEARARTRARVAKAAGRKLVDIFKRVKLLLLPAGGMPLLLEEAKAAPLLQRAIPTHAEADEVSMELGGPLNSIYEH